MKGLTQFHQLPVFARIAPACMFCTECREDQSKGVFRMTAFKRWIALAPAALVLLAGLPGCKTGAKMFSCHQTSCATTDSCKSGCADSSKTACANGGKTVCAEASSHGCLGNKVSCTAVSGCRCGADGKGCMCGHGNANGCKSSCASTAACATSAGCISNGKTSCASIGCVTTAKSACNTAAVTITPKAMTAKAKPAYEAHLTEANPFETEPAIMPQGTPAQKNAELLNPQEQIEEFSLPIPAPPAEFETSQTLENPFLTVSQTEESEAVPSADSETLVSGRQKLSQPWSDALGLPAEPPGPIQPYHANK
jgi:hypothetical protein